MDFVYDKLRGKIKEKFGTQEALAKAMELNDATLSNKLNNITYFTQKEIAKLQELLDISDTEISIYFFTPKVRINEQKEEIMIDLEFEKEILGNLITTLHNK